MFTVNPLSLHATWKHVAEQLAWGAITIWTVCLSFHVLTIICPANVGISVALSHLQTIRCRRILYYILQERNASYGLENMVVLFGYDCLLTDIFQFVNHLLFNSMVQGWPARRTSGSNLVKSHVFMFVSVSDESHFCTKSFTCCLQSTSCACKPLTIPFLQAINAGHIVVPQLHVQVPDGKLVTELFLQPPL